MVASRFGATVTLLHVRSCDAPADDVREVRELARWLERCVDGVEFRETATTGKPAPKIVEASYAEPYDLIMMPARRRRFGWLTGRSAAEWVVSRCRCAVWTAPESYALNEGGLQNIVCAIDLGSESAAALSAAADIADLLRGTLSILHGMPAIDESLLQLAALDELPVTLSRTAAEREIARLQRLTGTVAPVHIETGELTRTVRRRLRRIGPGLLVVGAGESAERTGKLGPNVLALLRAAGCPVLVLEKGWAFQRASRGRRLLRAFASRSGSVRTRPVLVEREATAHKGSLVRVFGRHRAG
jgi:nucleotide-binding universal stress UspA family protein